jgi:hypothetical protein
LRKSIGKAEIFPYHFLTLPYILSPPPRLPILTFDFSANFLPNCSVNFSKRFQQSFSSLCSLFYKVSSNNRETFTAKQYGKKDVSPLNEIRILHTTEQEVKRNLFFEKILLF